MLNEISTNEYKEIVNDVLIYLHEICKKNNILYYLAYGSLLGAVRHKGFIPWDDDVDVIMDRVNFERFVQTVRDDSHQYYKLMWLTEDKTYDLPLPKLVDNRTELVQSGRKSKVPIGAWVDIMVIDDVPDDPKKRSRVLKKYDFYEQCWNWSQYTNFSVKNARSFRGFIKNIIMRMLSLPGSRYWSEKLYRSAAKYNNKGYKAFSSLTYSAGTRKCYQKEWLGKGTLVEFEGREFVAPENWDAYLKNAYGDYMKLPDEERRVSNHNYTVYYK